MQCGNISYSYLSLLSTIMIKLRLFCICVLNGEHMSDFLHLLFKVFSSLLGGMSVSVVLLHGQDNFSFVFIPYSFNFICIRHMIGKIGGKWQTAMT